MPLCSSVVLVIYNGAVETLFFLSKSSSISITVKNEVQRTEEGDAVDLSFQFGTIRKSLI